MENRMFKHSKARKVVATAAVIGVASLTWAAVIWAQGQNPPAGPGGVGGRPLIGRMMMGRAMIFGRIARQLGLTDAQKQDIRAIVQSHKTDFQALAQQAMPVRQQLQAAIQNGDTATIQALGGQLGQLAVDRALLATKVRQEVFAKLTPEQRDKAVTMQQQFQGRIRNWRQKRQ
jgi:Spy/CpxP family protein refolding chaperone